MPDYGRLVRASMALRAEAPQGWDEFVMAMREQAATMTQEILRVPPEMLVRAQGMAIMAHELASVVRDAPAMHEKMMERKHGKAS